MSQTGSPVASLCVWWRGELTSCKIGDCLQIRINRHVTVTVARRVRVCSPLRAGRAGRQPMVHRLQSLRPSGCGPIGRAGSSPACSEGIDTAVAVRGRTEGTRGQAPVWHPGQGSAQLRQAASRFEGSLSRRASSGHRGTTRPRAGWASPTAHWPVQPSAARSIQHLLSIF